MKKTKNKGKKKNQKKNKPNQTKLIILLILLVVIILIILELNLFLIRALAPKNLDDVSPGIPCEKELMQEADIYWIIPKFSGKKISDNQTWCEEILKSGKEIGLHGLQHTYNEFATNETKETELKEAINIFEKCFGYKPIMFKAPQLKLSEENEKLLKEYNLTIVGNFNSLTHKVYHCNDTGVFSNKAINIF